MMLPSRLHRRASEAGGRLHIGFPWWLRPLLARDVAGITLGRRVYLSPEVRLPEMERLVRHELVHVRQIVEKGVVAFYWRYLSEYVRNRRAGMTSRAAYLAISFEREASEAESGGAGDDV